MAAAARVLLLGIPFMRPEPGGFGLPRWNGMPPIYAIFARFATLHFLRDFCGPHWRNVPCGPHWRNVPPRRVSWVLDAEDGRRTRGTCGAPQGAVISPILTNVYLHYVYDLWVHRWRRTKASGDMIVIRYADDTIVGFQHEHEARAFLGDLKERMCKFELALHPDKTRFGRNAATQREKLGEGKPETFDFPRLHPLLHAITENRHLCHRVGGIGWSTIGGTKSARKPFLSPIKRTRNQVAS
jgi:hypothetical protein